MKILKSEKIRCFFRSFVITFVIIFCVLCLMLGFLTAYVRMENKISGKEIKITEIVKQTLK